EEVVEEVAPNLLAVAGPLISARLISIAGGVENLAKLPASTVQVLGAEKALFRALKTGARPPKHGVIFQYGPIHQAPRWQRGKLARAFSGKLAIAARLDAFGGGFEGERLKAGFDNRVAEIQQKYPSPPEKKRERRGRKGKRAWKN
ncbi:MAG: C/D box methylation guide ribonucleoprotein complex aNOP56 subunit, partial [Candidatus Bathyarchaeia archaeon]